MQAAVFHGPGDIRVEDVPRPTAGPGELVLKVEACTVCGTDIRIFRGRKTRGVRVPSILGHEFAGTIAEVGDSVTGYVPGERVAVAPVYPCGSCYYCKNGRENACLNRQAMGYEFDGAFAEYVRIPAIGVARGHVFRFSQHLNFQQAALAEPLGCCVNGQKNADVRLGDTVVILGAGPIGLLHVQLARAAGASKIIVSEPMAHRAQTASALGADLVVNPASEDLLGTVKSETEELGADVVIVAIGMPALVAEALGLVRKGGNVNLFAGFSGDGASEIPANLIHYNEITMTGTTACTRSQYQKALRLIESGQVAANQVITHQVPLSDIDEALRLAESGTGIKVAVIPHG